MPRSNPPRHRLRLRDGVPLAVEDVQISQRLCPGLDRFDLARNSLYAILEESYGLRLEHLQLANPDVLVMHPGPINRGRELSSEVADSQRSVILNQVENGVAVRMAVLESIVQ